MNATFHLPCFGNEFTSCNSAHTKTARGTNSTPSLIVVQAHTTTLLFGTQTRLMVTATSCRLLLYRKKMGRINTCVNYAGFSRAGSSAGAILPRKPIRCLHDVKTYKDFMKG